MPELRRLGKRIVVGIEEGLLLIIHLMIAGRLLRRGRGQGFPEKVTAFREGMAVHGRFGRPCPSDGR